MEIILTTFSVLEKKQVFGYVFELDGKFWWNIMM